MPGNARVKLAPQGANIRELIGKAVTNKKLTRPQATSLLRHQKHHTEGHLLFMMRMMIEQHMSFKDAHERAMKQVGK